MLAGDNVSDQTAIVTRLIATGQLSEAVHWQNRLGLHVDSGLSPEELERMMREEADRYLSLPWPISDDSHVRMVDNHESLERLTDSVWGCVPARCTPFVRGQRGRKEEGEICTQTQLRNHGGMPSLTQCIDTHALVHAHRTDPSSHDFILPTLSIRAAHLARPVHQAQSLPRSTASGPARFLCVTNRSVSSNWVSESNAFSSMYSHSLKRTLPCFSSGYWPTFASSR